MSGTGASPTGPRAARPASALAPPDNGIAVVDYRDPANPQLVSRLVNPTGTSAEDVVVFTARFGPYAGRDIAAAGLQVCGGSRLDESFPRGLMLWDVTNPAAPVQLGLANTGCCTQACTSWRSSTGPIWAAPSSTRACRPASTPRRARRRGSGTSRAEGTSG